MVCYIMKLRRIILHPSSWCFIFRSNNVPGTGGNRSYRNVSTNVPDSKFIAVSFSHLKTRQFLHTHCSYQTPTHSSFSAHRFDFHNMNITVEGRVPELNFTGEYKLAGKLVGHQIHGHGPFHIPYRKFSCGFLVLWLF